MSQSLFTVQTPALPDNSDGTPGIVTATTMMFLTAGQVSGVRWYCTVNTGGNWTGYLWEVSSSDPGGSGILLASKTFVGTPTSGTWNTITFTTPVTITPNTKLYRVGIFNDQGRYVATLNFPPFIGGAGGLTNGNIKAPNNGDNPVGLGNLNQGTFLINATAAYPSAGGNATCYFVDVLFDPTGGAVDLAANLTGTGSLAASLVDEPRVASALTGTGVLSAATQAEARLAANLTGTGSLTARLNTTSGGPVDPIGSPVANALLGCLTEQMNTLPSPPARIQLRVGQETGPLIGPNVDECCAGLAWVRVADIYPSWDSFPGPDNTWLPCGPLAYAVVLEMGTAFCMPWSDSEDAFENVDPPSTGDWQTAFQTLMQHQTLMRRAAACCFPYTQRRAVGEWAPLSVEGGCTGGTLRVTVSVMAPCGDC